MATYHRKFALEILTPDGPILSTEAVSVILPAADGQLGILGGHSPVLAMLGAGALVLEDEAGSRRQFFVAGGFANVREAAVHVLAEQCMEANQLRPEVAQGELDRAQQMPQDTPEAKSRRQEALTVAKAKVRMVAG